MDAQRIPPPSDDVRRRARELLATRPWRTVRNARTGVRFLVVPSTSKPGVVHQVHPLGRGCSCDAAQRSSRPTICVHMLAVRLALSEDARRAMDEPSARYCQALACVGRAVDGETYCERHRLVDAF